MPAPRLRELLEPGRGTLIAGVFDALSARAVQASGIEVGYVSGAGVANAHLGAPDLGLVTATEMATHIAACRDAVQIPLIADADTGFGNALNLVRTVRAFERAGANAIQIEDQVFPKRCGHFEGKRVVPVEEMVQKVRAAVDTRISSEFLVVARPDALAVEGFQATLDRAAAYLEAGADVLFIEAPECERELREIPRCLPGRHLCNIVHGGRTPMLPREVLATFGSAGILYANAALQAAMLAMRDTLRHLREVGSLAGIEDKLVEFADRQVAVDLQSWLDLGREYGADPGEVVHPRAP